MRIELDAVRETGYAVEARELRDDECGAAAPVVSGSGSMIAVLGVSVEANADLASLGQLVTATARRLAGTLDNAAR